ncbi:MAG TPA: methyltransferase domain-containing protein [Patescibacteria group bacterium]|nr:methyltransferase domain-containing protein [Patescibacteria group bacterium]
MTYKSVMILGRQPAIGRAELESVLGAGHVYGVGSDAAASDLLPQDIPFARLGSTVKLARFVATVNGTDWRSVQDALAAAALACAEDITEGKIQFGLSAYGLRVNPRQLLGAGLTIKKSLRNHGYSVRLIPNQEEALNSAQVLHNHLTGERGIELLAVQDGSKTIIARTVNVQDITAYAHRDQNRPKRDARVGMLPPKLAQTIVNLAAGPLPPSDDVVVLDPFCGTGVLLQEAALMGYGTYGTDLEPRMIEYSKANLAWLAEKHTVTLPALAAGDATSFTWQNDFTAVAGETYLGRPLAAWPANDVLERIIQDTNTILQKFLVNIRDQIKPGLRMCLAVPAWHNPTTSQFKHLPLLDHLTDMGYNRVSFEHAALPELVYYRQDQLVARELLVITRN